MGEQIGKGGVSSFATMVSDSTGYEVRHVETLCDGIVIIRRNSS